MPKTARILSYLPGTFRALPRPTALYALVDAFGADLLKAENSLAAIMQAHWVDHADRGAQEIDDLARIAALYGLAPRQDESVEAFREHLKRYVRTFLEGTVTVQGILRVTAEALGLHIADAYADMDTWWTREHDELITVAARGDDAAAPVLGVEATTVTGTPARPAQISGTADLSSGADLREASVLRLKVDDAGPVTIDLATAAADPAAVTLDELVTIINAALEAAVARHDGRYLALASPTTGPTGRLEVQDVARDAADRLLDLPPRVYRGAPAAAARVTGSVDLSDGVDLREERYLRLLVDGAHLAEIDCAGPDPAHTSLDQVRDAINDALGLDLAGHDGHFLILTSPTTGVGSTIACQRPAAQDATARLLGPVAPLSTGRNAQPAQVTGRRDLSAGVDLSERSRIRVRLDGAAPVTVQCAGADPANTQLADIVAAINAALGNGVAGRAGRFIQLTSPTVGSLGEIIFETLSEGDATEDIFGIGSRTFSGRAATAAQLAGSPDLSSGANLWARHLLRLGLDGGAPVEIDLRDGAADPGAVTLHEMAAAIDAALGSAVASHDGQHLSLQSPTLGRASRLTVEPLTATRRRRFVTRAAVTGEAAQAIFGFVAGEARGEAATRARLTGAVDLSRGVDLRENRYVRLAIDHHPAVDVDCAGLRPRATTIDEVVQALNLALGMQVAAHDGRHLVLASPTSDAGSRIAFEPPRATDALDRLLGVAPGVVRGQDATRVNFVGTIDLSRGVDLSGASHVRIAIDGAAAVEIDCAGVAPAQTKLNEIVIAINLGLGRTVASHDGTRLLLTSPSRGAASQIAFDPPDAPDATAAICGITPPRRYHGREATPAHIVGTPDLSGGVDLRTAHFLRLSTSGIPAGAAPAAVDCAAQAADPAAATLDEIVASINTEMGGDVASHDGSHLILQSLTTGQSGRLTLAAHTAGDARPILLGAVEAVVEGRGPGAAVITGTADLLNPVDLSQRRLLRLAVNGEHLVDIDVAGLEPTTTFLAEIVDAINRVFPGMATATEDDHLQITAPTTGAQSHLSLLPLRFLELIEYRPEATSTPPRAVKHADAWPVDNDGAAESAVVVEITAPQGTVGPTLLNATTGWRVQLLTTLGVGETARLWQHAQAGIRAAITAPDGTVRAVPGAQIRVGPAGEQVWVPFTAEQRLYDSDDGPATLQLNNPLAPAIVVLRARQPHDPGQRVTVSVRESDFSAAPAPLPAGDGPVQVVGRIRFAGPLRQLVDAGDTVIAHLQTGADVDLATYRDRIVIADGHVYAGEPPLLIVQRLALRFDVTLRSTPEASNGSTAEVIEESYAGVTIGTATEDADALVRRINTAPSQLVKAASVHKRQMLNLPRGRSQWRYLDCHGDRFDHAHFGAARFAGGLCADRGVFDSSRFGRSASNQIAVFAPSPLPPAPTAAIVFYWASHRPGTFQVNLPIDLPVQFGGRFNQVRFGQARAAGEVVPELYAQAVTEPLNDPFFLVDLINTGRPQADPPLLPSHLVEAAVAPFVPLGWEAVQMPFGDPQPLTLGSADAPARLYLAEAGLDGFIELRAREAGAWGNDITVSARLSGPALYDVAIRYEGVRFENARQVVLGQPLPALVQDLLQPSAAGVLQAKAAGVETSVTRAGAGPE